MIDRETFQALDLTSKIRILYRQGDFIVNIRYYKHKVNLYCLGNFLVEVFYNHQKDRIDKVELFDYNSTRTKFYADQIRLPSNIL